MGCGTQGLRFALGVCTLAVVTGCGAKFKAMRYSGALQNQAPIVMGPVQMPSDPNAELTRRHIAILIAETFRLNQVAPSPPETFTDIRLTDYGGLAVHQLLKEGLALGCRQDAIQNQIGPVFCPDQIVTVWQMLIQVGRGLSKFQQARVSLFDASARGTEFLGSDAAALQRLNGEAVTYAQVGVDYRLIESDCKMNCLLANVTLKKAREILQQVAKVTAQTVISTVNAKVLPKNIVQATGSPAGYTVRKNNGQWTCNPSSPQNFDGALQPVAISGTDGDQLKNSDIHVHPTVNALSICNDDICLSPSEQGNRAQRVNGQWLPTSYSTTADTAHLLGQVMAYHWLNQTKILSEALLSGSWHPKGKGVDIYSRCYNLEADATAQQHLGWNAFWSGDSGKMVCMGYLGPAESAFDASVYVHEMGHANIDFGTNGMINQGATAVRCNGFNAWCCPSSAGCAGAINEGQADVHSFIMFDSPRLGEGFMNTLDGFSERAGDRTQFRTAAEMFAFTKNGIQIGQEIHYLGGVWGAAWWTLRKRIGSEASDKLFFAHISMLTGSDTFRTALNKILVARSQVLAERGSALDAEIVAVFKEHGIERP